MAIRWGMWLRSDDPELAATSGADHPGPDVRMSDIVVHDEFQAIHLDAVIEEDAHRAGLPAPPAEPVDPSITLIEGPSPLLAAAVIAVCSDPLVQPERAG